MNANTIAATSFSVEHAGRTIFIRVSPCSWMHKGYGLQIGLSMKDRACNAETIFDLDKSFDASDKPASVLAERAREQAAKWLAANGVGKLAKALDDWAEASAKFEKEIAAENAKRAAKAALEDAKRKAEGFTHKFMGWVHPKNGDDYQVGAYFKGEPTAAQIASMLKRSVVKNDYTVTAL